MRKFCPTQSIAATIDNIVEYSLNGGNESMDVLHVLSKSCQHVLAGCQPLSSIDVQETSLLMHYVHVYTAIHKLYKTPSDTEVGITLPELARQLILAIEKIDLAPESWTEYLFSYLKQPLSEKTQLLTKTAKSSQGSPSKYG